MLKFTRVTGILDVGRLGNALARPGIDPRTWVSYAAVDAVGVDSEGVFVDVTLLPTGDQMTARAGTIYAGPGYGLHLPFGVGDEVVVGVPNGDPNHGAVVLARLQSASDELASSAMANENDIVLVVKPDQSIRIAVSGGGKVYLGSVDASRGVARVDDIVDFDYDRLQTILDSRYMQVGSPVPLSTTAAATPGNDATISTASDTVVSE